MKKTNYTADKSAPYRNISYEKISAPNNTSKNNPKSTKIVGKTDLRAGGRKNG